jgi:glycosyltransferase involved in cell wall biosynthesis
MCKITVIIPVYNGERFLHRVLESLRNQSDTDFEAVFINDGSTDQTGTLLQQYASQYSWIKVFSQNNKGLSGARNTGIREAAGEYLLFLDADDYIEPGTINAVKNIIIQYSNVEMIAYGMNYVNEKGIKYEAPLQTPTNRLLDHEYIKQRIIPCMINVKDDKEAFIFDYAWNKVYKKSLIDQYNIRFLETRRVWEDRPFVVQYLNYANNLFVIDKCLYDYVNVSDSLSQKYDHQFFDIILENYALYQKWFEGQYDFCSAYANSYWSKSIDNMIGRALKQTDNLVLTKNSILNTIKQKQVKEWFENRKETTIRDRRITKLILGGNIEQIIGFYSNEKERTSRQNRFRKMVNRILKRT